MQTIIKIVIYNNLIMNHGIYPLTILFLGFNVLPCTSGKLVTKIPMAAKNLGIDETSIE